MADDPKAQPDSAAAGSVPDSQAAGSPDASKGTVLTDPKAGEPAAKPDAAAGDPKAAKPDDKGKAKEGAPEKYEDFAAPEGVELDKEMLGKFTGIAKALNLPQVGAQKLVDLAAEHTKNIVQQQQVRWSEIRQEWVNELKADKEFGGEKFNETIVGAKRALGKFGSPKMVEFLESTGYGDNAELIRFMARVDKATREDRAIDGGPAGAAPQSAAAVIYPTQGKS